MEADDLDGDPVDAVRPGIAPRNDTVVILDFDGTITLEDSVDAILERHAHAGWLEIERDWQSGRIGSRACMEQQIACLTATPDALDAVIDGLTVDESLPDVVAVCAARGFRLIVASDGLDLVVRRTLARIGCSIPFVANSLTYLGDQRWSLSPATTADACRVAAANCKCRFTARHTILIGDGRSDFCIAHRAELVLAKGRLASYCARERLPWIAIDGLADAAEYLAIHQAPPRPLANADTPDASRTGDMNR